MRLPASQELSRLLRLSRCCRPQTLVLRSATSNCTGVFGVMPHAQLGLCGAQRSWRPARRSSCRLWRLRRRLLGATFSERHADPHEIEF